jgi:hypothetical protein
MERDNVEFVIIRED